VLLGTWLIDKISRRLFLTGSFYICAMALFAMTVWQDIPTLWALICISTFSFVISAASVLEFAYPPELFSTELRASGVGFSVACSRVGGAGGTFLLPIVMEKFGTSVALAGCVAALLIGGVVCQLYAPETRTA
jgi:putative MFS transporter